MKPCANSAGSEVFYNELSQEETRQAKSTIQIVLCTHHTDLVEHGISVRTLAEDCQEPHHRKTAMLDFRLAVVVIDGLLTGIRFIKEPFRDGQVKRIKTKVSRSKPFV